MNNHPLTTVRTALAEAQALLSASAESLVASGTPADDAKLAGAAERLTAALAVVDGMLASAQPAPAAVPAGWQLVPVEPTEAMAKAYFSLPMRSWRQQYAAMLAAAPAPATAGAAWLSP